MHNIRAVLIELSVNVRKKLRPCPRIRVPGKYRGIDQGTKMMSIHHPRKQNAVLM